MCFGGGGSSTPPPLPAPPPPPEEPKKPARKSFQQDTQTASRSTDKQVAAYQSGRKKTILTGSRGDQSEATLGQSTLLGA